MIQDSIPDRDPCEDYWATYTREMWVKVRDLTEPEILADNPWVNGRYAFASMVWALIFMLTVSLGVGL